MIEGEVVPTNPTLTDLNNKAIEKLYALIDSLDGKSEPDMVRACVESLSKLNSSLRNSDIIQKEETAEERADRIQRETFGSILRGEEG